MRNLLFVISLLLFSSGLIAQNGVQWESDVNSALAKAKTSNKLLFVEAYLPTCPACQAVAPIFEREEVGKVYNEHFISYKMDVTSPDGPRKFLDERNIRLPSFPQFLFFNGDGELVHQGEAGPQAEAIIGVGNEAANPEAWSSNYAKRFEAGDRDLSFLIKYGVYTRLTSDTTANHQVADVIFDDFPKEDLDSRNSWVITQKVVTTVENGFFKYWINNLPKARDISAQIGQRGQEINVLGLIVQSTLFSSEPRSYSTEKLQELRKYMQIIGAGQYADTYLWEFEMLAKIRENQPQEAFKIGEDMVSRFSNNAPSLIYITKVFIDSYPDLSYLPKAYSWLEQSKPQLSENTHLAEYHFQLARLQLKEDKTAEAKGNLEESLKYANSAGLIDVSKYENLLKSLD